MAERKNIKNIAIIAHVDHGTTTLVDEMLHQSGIFRDNEVVQERVMDSNDLEKERGITILSKNTSIHYKDTKINIVDTPGHADFGGEVERILTMVDGVLLLVDAFEGCMPQTRFVLKKALALKKTPLVVVNKVDREGARPEEVVDEVLDLFIELGADDDQIDFPVVYASARDGYSSLDPNVRSGDMRPLLDAILENIPSPSGDPEGPAQILFCSLEYDDYVGRIGVGRVQRGTIKHGNPYVLCRQDGTQENVRFSKIYQFEGLKRVECQEATFGDLVCVAGIPDLNIGETACDPDCIEPLPFVKIDEPTISMNFIVNDSPFAGREGKYVTSRNLRDRLFKEVETNVSMRVEETDSMDTFKVSGRGELHLSILIETMRRENYEFQVSRPQVIFKKDSKTGETLEPMEIAIIEVPEEYVGSVMEKLCSRKGEIQNMDTRSTGMTHLEIKIPSRGLIGYRSEFLTDTNGNGIMNQLFSGYEPYKGEIQTRSRGSIVVHETGTTTGYGLWNVCKKKHVTNTRASGSDEALKLVPPTTLSLEQSMEFLADDELLEVTPQSIRLRKTILNKELRLKAENRAKK